MDQIVDPATSRTKEHDTLLQCLDRWLSDPWILSEALRTGRRRRDVEIVLAAVRFTLDGKGGDGTAVDAPRAARLVFDLLAQRAVRKAVIRHEIQRTGYEVPRRAIIQGLREARLHAKALSKEGIVTDSRTVVEMPS